MTELELEDLLKDDLALDKVRTIVGNKGKNFMFCCPFHGESKPSAGLVMDSEDGGLYGQCFSCEETFSLPKLVAHVLDLTISGGIDYLEEKFNADFRVTGENTQDRLRRYEDVTEHQEEKAKRRELSRVKLAPFRSGKETHKYFFERGFTKETMQGAMIGWDRARKRVTIPIFHPDGVLAGFIGRAVLPDNVDGRPSKKYRKYYGNEPKYWIYDNLPIAEIMYGSHEFESETNTAIIVEGTLDRLWLRQLGFTNVLSIIVAKMSRDRRNGDSTHKQILRELGVENVVFMHDNDKAGRIGKKVAYDILKDEFACFDTQYPEGMKDPVGMTREEVNTMLQEKTFYGSQKIPKYE